MVLAIAFSNNKDNSPMHQRIDVEIRPKIPDHLENPLRIYKLTALMR